MTEQQQREKLEKAHAAWDREFKEREIELPVAHQHRGILLTWLRERDGQIASLQKELARFQRADVGERVRVMERICEQNPDLPDPMRMRHDLFTICRQQAAEIERLNREVGLAYAQRNEVRQEASDLQQRLDDARHFNGSWKRCAKKWRHDHKRDTDRLYREAAELRFRLVEYEDAPTDKHERVEQFEEIEELPGFPCQKYQGCPHNGTTQRLGDVCDACKGSAPASEEAYRPGLPPHAIIDAVYEAGGYWERVEGVDIYLRYDSSLEVCAVRNGYGFVLANEVHLNQHRYRPHAKRWSEVEQEAAKTLGAEDAKAGRERMEDHQLAKALHGGRLAGSENRAAYRAAYDAAKGG